MATSGNAFLSTAGSADYVNPTVWSDAIEQVARDTAIMPAMGVIDNRGVGTAMEQLNIAKNQEMTAASLTEGTATPVGTLAFNQVTVTFGEYGLAKQVGELQLAYGLKGVFNDITMLMGEALGLKKDDVIIAACATGAKNTIYADAATSGSISSTNVFDTDLIAEGITKVRTEKRAAKFLVVHPNCENTLLKDSQFVHANLYGSREVLMSGEIGMYLGIKVFSYNRITSATENSVTVYKNLLFAQRPFVLGQKVLPKVRWAEDSVLDRAITFEAHEAYGVSVLNV